MTNWQPYEPATLFDGLNIIVPVPDDGLAV